MTYFLIAGEASGDLHASNLMKELREKDAQAIFVGLGGDKMREQGCQIYVDYRDMAYMGFVAVLQNLRKIKRNFHIAKQALLQEKPDVLILIDYPSFNLKIAKFCKQHLPNTRVVYYIPPKIWAWKKWRVHEIAKYCDRYWVYSPLSLLSTPNMVTNATMSVTQQQIVSALLIYSEANYSHAVAIYLP
jgi:lipid-A-disaccharide synthase